MLYTFNVTAPVTYDTHSQISAAATDSRLYVETDFISFVSFKFQPSTNISKSFVVCFFHDSIIDSNGIILFD